MVVVPAPSNSGTSLFFGGISISLVLALVILVIATNNWVIALMSAFVIFMIVVCVIGFSVMLGWKLGKKILKTFFLMCWFEFERSKNQIKKITLPYRKLEYREVFWAKTSCLFSSILLT